MKFISVLFIGFFLFINISLLQGQEDSIQLRLEELSIQDIHTFEEIEDDQKMISGSRTLQRKSEIPFTSYIITKDEILDNGFVTLVDVLKYLPGIRVSQPGSAVEGELFMMRGLKGNSYTKILINNVPIKPSIVGGMPIGAQLPIRQAERIEVIYGPAAVLYGADASAGVINIITKSSERPVYVQADLSIGTNGFTHLDVLFGGKLGKGKNILRYVISGSSTIMNSRFIYYDEENLYNPSNYTLNPGIDTQYVFNPNYKGNTFSPRLEKTPHLSRLVSTELKYKIVTLSTELMYRRDHSSIGLSPLAVSYANPNNYYGENILRANLNIEKNKNKFGTNTNITYLRYEIDENSSFSYIEEKLSRVTQSLLNNIPNLSVRDSLRNVASQAYFSGNRFAYALSNDLRAEQLFYLYPSKYIDLTLGVAGSVSIGQPVINYRSSPFDNSGLIFGIDTSNLWSLQPAPFYYSDWSSFLQTQFNFEKFKGLVGYRYYKSFIYGGAHTPQVALLYKIKDNLNIRASYGLAFRVPSPFYQANIFEIDTDNISEISIGDETLSPERTSNYEVGVRYNFKKIFSLDISSYYTQTQNFLSFNFDEEQEFGEDESEFILGYFNSDSTSAEIYGIQSHFNFNFNYPRFDSKISLNLNYNIGKETLPFSKGVLDVVRGQPAFIGQLNIAFRFWQKSILIHLHNVYISSHVRSNVFNQQRYESNKEIFTNKGYYTLDFLARYKISKNFQGYIKVNNVFNKEYAGIDATGTLDDLRYNPQSLRTLFFGLSYRIE